MGNQESRISNYNIKRTLIENDYFSVLEAISKKDNSNNVSIFKYKNKLKLSDKGAAEDLENILFKNAIQRIKTIRHPGIIRFRDADIYSESPAIITESVVSLNSVLNDITPENLCTGIFNLLKTIEFLHQSCKLVYNNICLESIFVPRNNYTKWLIGEFQYSIPISTSKSESNKIIEKIPLRLQPAKNNKEENGFHRDYWLIGKLIEEIVEFYVGGDKGDKKASNINWSQLKQISLEMQDPNPQNRKSVTEVINEPFFNNNIVIEVLEYIKNYKIKDENERRNCLSILQSKMKLMSRDILEKNIIPEIIQKEIINDSFSDILFSEIFKDPIKGNIMISEDYYKNKIIPYIMETIKLRQWGTRIVLLKLIDNYFDAFIRYDNEENKNRELIITEVLIGLEDVDQDIYLNSFNALTKILMKINLKNESNNQNYDKNIDETLSTIGNRKNSNANEKIMAIPEKSDSSYLNINTLINRFVIPHFVRIQISDNKDQKIESLNQVVELWKHFISIEKDDFDVGQTAKTINLSILKTMKFIIKLFKEDELQSLFNNIFLKDILNKPDAFGFYYVSSYIMTLLVAHLPRSTLNVRNSEILILHNLLDYLSNCPENNLIGEDTSSNVKKLKNIYSNKSQTLEKYHFIKAGPVRKTEKTLSRNNTNSISSTSLNLSSNSNSRIDFQEDVVNKKEDSFNIPDKKNDNKIIAQQIPNKESPTKIRDMESKNEINDFTDDKLISNDIANDDPKLKTVVSNISETNKPVSPSSAWDSFNDKNEKANDGWNFDWSDSEENDNSMNIRNEKGDEKEKQEFDKIENNISKLDKESNVSGENIASNLEENDEFAEPVVKKPIITGATTVNSVNKAPAGSSMKSMKLGKKKDNKESSLKKKLEDLNKMQKLKSQKKKENDVKNKKIEDIMSLISNDSPNTLSNSNSVLSLNKFNKSTSPLRSSNVESSKKNKVLSDFDSIANEEADLINSGWDDLDDIEGPAESNNWNVDSTKSESKIENTNKQISDGWGDFNIKDDWNEIPNIKETDNNAVFDKNMNIEKTNNSWDFNNDFEIPMMPEIKEVKNEEKTNEQVSSWEFNDDFDIPEIKEEKKPEAPVVEEIRNEEKVNEPASSWDFNDDFDIPEIKEEKKPEEPVTKNEEKTNEAASSWDFNDDFDIPEIKEEKKPEESIIEETKTEKEKPEEPEKPIIEEIINEENKPEEPVSSWDFNDDFDIPEIKEEKKPEEPIVEETKTEKEKPEEPEKPVAEETKNEEEKPEEPEKPIVEEIINEENKPEEPVSSWDFNDDFDIPEVKEEKKPEEPEKPVAEETKNEEKVNEAASSWDFNDDFDIPEIKEEKKPEESIIEETKTEKEKPEEPEKPIIEEIINEENKPEEPVSSWDFNDDFDIPEVKEEKKPEEPVVEEINNEEEKPEEPEKPVAEETKNEEKVNEAASSWDFNDDFDIPEVKEEKKPEEPVVEEINNEKEKPEKPVAEETKNEEKVNEAASSWDFNDDFDIPEVKEEKKPEEPVVEEINNEEEKPEEPEKPVAEETKNEEEKPEEPEKPIVEEIINEENKPEEPVSSWDFNDDFDVPEIKEESKPEEPIIEETKTEEEKPEEPVKPVIEESTVEKSLIEEEIKIEEPVVEESVIEDQPKEEKTKAENTETEDLLDLKDNLDIPETDRKETSKESENIEEKMDSENQDIIEKAVEVVKGQNKNGELMDDVEIIEEKVIEIVREVDEIDPNNPNIIETVEVVEELIEVKDGDKYETISRKVIEPESPTKINGTKANKKKGKKNKKNKNKNKKNQKGIKKEITTEETLKEETNNLINPSEESPAIKEEVKVDDLLDLNDSAPAVEVKNEVKVDDLLDLNGSVPTIEVKNEVKVDDLLNLNDSAPVVEVKNDVKVDDLLHFDNDIPDSNNKLIDIMEDNTMKQSNSWDFDDDLEIPDFDNEKKD
ncbi:hypothetical protein BCR36DRAFT_348146 [Piromyces finnis]|uniref:Protein kinase domain-containing protein n=1 Tax=Piromyces finnis TaxID=1754191 RepID=A0A1Y1VE86_9FUNG|nr:hypothetical protein BCR36DRAFT_348146 [Piromyces finnis]|eukprot:ORX54175.1 hypothetical protein BCR36DRAFT_348146 [Piromyces finnis]